MTDGQYAIPRFYAVRRAVKTVFLIRCFRNVRLSQSSLTALACSDCCLSNCTATLRGSATIEFVMVGGKQTNDGGVTQLRRLRQIRNCVSRDVMAQLVMSLVISRLDYCNSMFSGLPASSLAPLQRVQNAAARLVHTLDQQSHITSALQQLHWLPDKFRIVFKNATLVHQILHNRCPSYLTDLPGLVEFNTADSQRYQLTSLTRAAVVKRTRTHFGKRAFSVCGPHTWNCLPRAVRNIESYPAFRRAFKSHLFHRATSEDKNGGLVNSTEEVCEEFNDFFCFSVFKRRN